MYLRKVKLRDIRCFEELVLDFDKVGLSAILAGDNGAGKSTLLRSIAMGLCDEDSASALLRELHGEFVRHGQDDGLIVIDLVRKNGKRYRIETKIISTKVFEKVNQKLYEFNKNENRFKSYDDSSDFPWESIFVSGYGAGLRTQGTEDFQHYVSVDAVYPLFIYDVPLQNPELAIRRLIDEARKKNSKSASEAQVAADDMWKSVRNILEPILGLEGNNQILLSKSGIEIKRDRMRSELEVLGDGHKSVITWILDLISWWMLAPGPLEPKRMAGIVLIDEIEQHLHPRWQQNIMPLLRNAFPKVQFITSTHTPIVISGTKDMPCFMLKDGQLSKENLAGWLAEDVFREMGLNTSRTKTYKDMIDEYDELYVQSLEVKLNREESNRLKSLERQIRNALPGHDPVITNAKLIALRNKLRK